jgi:hypothetical protein
MGSTFRVFAIVTALVFVAALETRAQVTTGTILGTVRDATGGVMPAATITVTNLGTQFSRKTTSDTQGQYAIDLLPLGQYTVEASAPGFRSFIQKGITVEVGRNARVDPVLELGAVAETVQIVADSPLVETATAGLGRTVTQDEVLNLPLVNRNVYNLLSLTAGVDRSESGTTFGYPSQTTIINGSPDAGAGAVNYYLDGGSNVGGLRNTGNPVPNPDAIQEFRVVTNSYSAEYGRFGGGAVDVITKSGTNLFQGSAFEFFRHDSLNAKRWTPGVSGLKDPLERHQFGGVLGGPLRRQKSFFFASYSGLRQESSVFKNTAIVPTDLERAGNFSQSRVAPRDPNTNQPFENNTIPRERFDPTALRILNDWVPRANLPGNFYEVEVPRPTDSDEMQLKVDHALNGAHRLMGTLPWVEQVISARQHNLNVSDDWMVSGSAFNTARFTYVRHFGSRVNTPFQTLGDLGSRFQLQGPPSLPQIGVTGYFSLNSAIFGPTAGSDLFMARDVLTLSRGRHAVKLGGEVSYEEMIHDTTLNNYGVFSFDGSRTGNALADFLLGLPRTMNQDAPIIKTDNVWFFSGFAQDDWRLSDRFTVNLGLRYDLQLTPTDPQNRKLTFVPGQKSQVVPTAPVGLLFPGDPGVGDGIVPADKNNVSPRLGVVWDPAGDGRTAVRAGFGVFYGSVSGNEWNQTADNQPFTIRQQFNNVFSLTDPYRNLPGGVSPYPYLYDPSNPRFLYPANIYGPSLDFVLPYTYQMNVSVQRELRRAISVTAAYVGALGRKYPLSPDLNYPVFGPTATAGNVDSRRPIQPGELARINLIQSIIGTDYHGLQVTMEKRGSRFTAKAYYSLGRAMEDASAGESTVQGSGATNPAQNSTRLDAERARTSTDRRHNFVASAIWKADYFADSNAIVRGLLNDWTISGILTLRSGAGVTVTSGLDRNLDGINNDRANLDGDWRAEDPNIEGWFNTAAFAQPAVGQDGTSARNLVTGPGIRLIDLGLFRDVPLRGSATLQFRVEATNAFNIVNFNNPGANLNAPATLGKIRGARERREIQLGLRLSF